MRRCKYWCAPPMNKKEYSVSFKYSIWKSSCYSLFLYYFKMLFKHDFILYMGYFLWLQQWPNPLELSHGNRNDFCCTNHIEYLKDILYSFLFIGGAHQYLHLRIYIKLTKKRMIILKKCVPMQ